MKEIQFDNYKKRSDKYKEELEAAEEYLNNIVIDLYQLCINPAVNDGIILVSRYQAA